MSIFLTALVVVLTLVHPILGLFLLCLLWMGEPRNSKPPKSK
jgi:hypothetical protein